MQIPVLIERVEDNGYRARVGEPFALTVEGPTRADALRLLREQIDQKRNAGAEFLTLDVPNGENPWVKYAGIFRDDPEFDAWQEAIAENRRRIDEDPNIP